MDRFIDRDVSAMTILRYLLALIIWLIDLVLKFAIGRFLVLIVWSCTAYPLGFSFGFGWEVASALKGVALVGFFDGCDIILNGFTKRLLEPSGRPGNS